jgi:glycosyltransferase involved in cell wall biosynthesis
MMSSEKNKLIRVMMLVPALPPLAAGGTELQALKLGKALGEKKVEVRFIMPGKKKIGGETKIGGMSVYRMNSWMNRLFDFLSSYKKNKQVKINRVEYDDALEITNQLTKKVGLPTIIYYNIFFFHALFFLWRRRKSFDIIHAHTMEWSAIVAVKLGKRLNKPVLIKDSTMNGFQSLSRFPAGMKHQRLVAGHAYFVAMTEIIYQNLVKSGIQPERITKISNGIDVEDTYKIPVRNQANPIVLFVGNLTQQPAKGVDILLRAWSIVRESFPTVILQVIGDGVNDAYQDYANKLGIRDSVQFLGKKNNLLDYYQHATIFVLPSRREGMSNALMEAMLNEMPCVATDISGSRDLIQNNVNGILIPPADVKSLANEIIYLLANPGKADEMGKRARETIVRDYDIRKIADRYISLYNQLLKKNISFPPES